MRCPSAGALAFGHGALELVAFIVKVTTIICLGCSFSDKEDLNLLDCGGLLWHQDYDSVRRLGWHVRRLGWHVRNRLRSTGAKDCCIATLTLFFPFNSFFQ